MDEHTTIFKQVQLRFEVISRILLVRMQNNSPSVPQDIAAYIDRMDKDDDDLDEVCLRACNGRCWR